MSYRGVFKPLLYVLIAAWLAGCATTGEKAQASKASLPPLKSALAPDEQRTLALDLAALYLRYGQPDQAKPILMHLRKKYPYDPQVLRLLSRYYAQTGKPDLGVKALQLLAKKHALTKEDEAFLGRLALRAGYFDYAENIFKRWTQTCQEMVCARAWNNLGIVYLAEKRLKKAKAAFTKALEYDPLDEKARHNLAAAIALETTVQSEEVRNGHQ